MTWDGGVSSSGITLYIDGVATVGDTMLDGTGTRSSDAPYDLVIGNNLANSRTFSGTLDDVRIYNRILSAAEVKQLYQLGQVTLNKTPAPAPKTAGNLVGWWTFDGKDTSSTTARDRSGLNNHCTLQGTPKPKPTAGKIGQGFLFSNVNGYLNCSSPATLDDLATMTITAWVHLDESSGGVAIKSDANAWSDGWSLFVSEGSLSFQAGFSAGSHTGWWGQSSGSIPSKQWTYVAATYDHRSASNDPVFYVNGQSVTTTEYMAPSGTYGSDANTLLYLGRHSETLSGTLDDVRIYNRILTAQEIKQLYDQTKGSVAGGCGPGPVVDRDGNKYSIVQIGLQCWLDRNMNVGTRINGATAQTNNGTIEKYCYSDTDANCTTNHPKRPDGGLYQWDEAMQYSTTEGAQGICPSGWHIPTDAEWHTLELFLTKGSGTCDGSRMGNDCSPAAHASSLEGTQHLRQISLVPT